MVVNDGRSASDKIYAHVGPMDDQGDDGSYIRVIGAKEHNLKDISIAIPRNQLVVFTGVSGSGKSTLAFDVIFAEAQREYVESLSSYARKSLPKVGRANVDAVLGLSPSLMIDQQPLARNPRSTVGTVTDLYAFLRLLFSRLGTPTLAAGDFSFNTPSGACETCTGLGIEFVPDLNKLIDWHRSLNEGALLHRNWAIGTRNWNILVATGLFDLDKTLKAFSPEELDLLLYSPSREFQNRAPGYIQNFTFEGIISRMMRGRRDARGLESNSYSDQFFSLGTCTTCHGARLNARARAVQVEGVSIVEMATAELPRLLAFLQGLWGPVAESIIPSMVHRIDHLLQLGVGYLSLNRSVDTLSGGESQKVKLARQLGSALTQLIYVLDEPTVGLHPRDVDHILTVLQRLVHKPNTVLVVEHDAVIMRNADYLIDLGPGPGILGGQVVAAGSPLQVMASDSLTGQYLSGRLSLPPPRRRCGSAPTLGTTPASAGTTGKREEIVIEHACLHNLKDLTVRLPRHALICISGVSGSGKSSLVSVLMTQNPHAIFVDQTPAGTSAMSIPATYVDAFGRIRQLFARASGQSESLFSFNSKGACQVCNGLGFVKTDLHFLGEVREMCPECGGQRFAPTVLAFHYRDHNIAEVLDMTITEATEFFTSDAAIAHKLQVLEDVGLGYLRLGQPLDTLSGGEAQRIKLASYLSSRGDIYVLDEPTRGLHPADVARLLTVLDRLVDQRNTVIVVEHDVSVMYHADWIVDLGPEGGAAGGTVIAAGPPEAIAAAAASYTGHYLAKLLVTSPD